MKERSHQITIVNRCNYSVYFIEEESAVEKKSEKTPRCISRVECISVQLAVINSMHIDVGMKAKGKKF